MSQNPCHLLLLRPPSPTSWLEETLRQYGVRLSHCPLTVTVELPSVVPNLQPYAWLWLTSQTAVQQVAQRYAAASSPAQWPAIAVVGPSTQQAVERHLQTVPKLVATQETHAMGLVQQWLAQQQTHTSTVLWPCSLLADPGPQRLAQRHGHSVTRWPLYTSASVAPQDACQALPPITQAPTHILYSSPSIVQAAAAIQLPHCFPDAKALVLGPRSAQAYTQAFGVPPTHSLETLNAETIRAAVLAGYG